MLTYVEPCCGSAAIALHLLGARQSLVPYQGSKWSMRTSISAALVGMGAWGQPSRVVLSDVLPWPGVIATAITEREAVVGRLKELVHAGHIDPDGTFDSLDGAEAPTCHLDLAATFLWLQRMAFAGKPVRIRDGRWQTPGKNPTQLFGRPGTTSFGKVQPQGPTLLRAVEALPEYSQIEAVVGGLVPPVVDGPTVVFIDPPYADTIGYTECDLSREDLVHYARAWREAGAGVVVSETGPVAELVADGWRSRRIRAGRRGTPAQAATRSRFRRALQGEEWLTLSR